MNRTPAPNANKDAPAFTVAVAVLGVLTAASYVYADRAGIRDLAALRNVALVQAALFVSAAVLVSRARLRSPALVIVLAAAALCRAPLALAPPRFSDDLYRYVWDGRVQAAGINPYRYVPADPPLARLRDPVVYLHINRRDYAPTIYPPVAQMLFFTFTRVGTVGAMKTGVLACDAVTAAMLMILLGRLGLPRSRVLLYAWNPLVIWQYAGDGHIDAAAAAFVAIALVAHARRREALAGIALGCATLVKWYPAVLFPALYRRGWKMPAAMAAVAVAAYLPYLGAGARLLGFLPGYAAEEGMVSGRRFFLLSLAKAAGVAVPVPVYAAIGLAILLAAAVWIRRRPERTAMHDIQGAALLASLFMVLFSTHYLWYFGWLALFLPAVPTLPLVYLTGAATYLFAALGPRTFGPGGPPIFDAALYGPAAALALASRAPWRGRRVVSGPAGARQRRGAGHDTGLPADFEAPDRPERRQRRAAIGGRRPRALVTGGAGLIGSHVADRLLCEGWAVRILDNLEPQTHRDGRPPWVAGDAEFVHGDVRDLAAVEAALRGIDVVFHQAAYGGFMPEMAKYMEVNVAGTAGMLELIRDRNLPVRKVIVASSQVVYPEGAAVCERHGLVFPPVRPIEQLRRGDFAVHCPRCGGPTIPAPTPEKTPLAGETVYAISKVAEEGLVLTWARQTGIPAVALRYSCTYGPRQSIFNPYTGVIAIVCTRLLSGLPPVVYEDGRQTRDFCFVEDIAEANLLAASGDAWDGLPVNVGTGAPTAICDLCAVLSEALCIRLEPVLRGEFRPGEIRHMTADISRARSGGYEPRTGLAAGIERYLGWIKRQAGVRDYFAAAESVLRAKRVVHRVSSA